MELEEQAMLSLLAEDLSGKICLDLACGSGRYMGLLLARQAKQVFGTDYSADMLAQVNNSQFTIQSRRPPWAIHNFLPLPRLLSP
jgi:malonyl-CoA O-methyltransferase